MISTKISPQPELEKTITLAEMKPLDMAVIVEGGQKGEVLMRTHALEFLNLSDPRSEKHIGATAILPIAALFGSRFAADLLKKTISETRVRLLPSGTQITLTVQ